jgi:hypothetical protein
MRVKHKDGQKSNSDPSMSLSHWQKHYYPNKKYLNYEFYDVKEIYDLYSIDQTNGNLTYVMSDFAHAIFPKVRENPTKFVYKEHDQKYLDEYLMPKRVDYLGVSFFKRIKAKIQQIISPSQNPNTIPFSRFEKWSLILMALAVIVPICIYIITEFNN